jgi:hypothetical protein
MISAKNYFEVTGLQHLGGYRLRVKFNDGTQREIDLSGFFRTPPPVFAALKDPLMFEKIEISPVGGVCWDNGADLGAEFLRDFVG